MYQSSGCFYICDSNLAVIKKIFSVHMCGFLHTGFLSGMEEAMVIFCLEEEIIDEELCKMGWTGLHDSPARVLAFFKVWLVRVCL